MKRNYISLVLILIPLIAFSEKIPIPELKSQVNDYTHTLSKDELFLLKSKLNLFEKDSLGQIVIIIIPTTGNESIEEFSIRLAENWKIGSAENDDGIILIVAKNDRKLRIEVGYGLESKLTDADAQRIIDYNITPEFKNGDFYTGLNKGVDAIITLITYSYDNTHSNSETEFISDEIDEQKQSELNTTWMIVSILFMTISSVLPYLFIKKGIVFYILLLIIIAGINYYLGRLTGVASLAIPFTIFSGFTIAIIIFLKIFAFLWGKKTGNSASSFFSGGSGSYTSSSSNWSSSSSSYGSSSSYSSGSSYSGGGGSFGGGGASGSW